MQMWGLRLKQSVQHYLALYHLCVFPGSYAFCDNDRQPRSMAKTCLLDKGVLALAYLVVFFLFQFIRFLTVFHLTDVDNPVSPLNDDVYLGRGSCRPASQGIAERRYGVYAQGVLNLFSAPLQVPRESDLCGFCPMPWRCRCVFRDSCTAC